MSSTTNLLLFFIVSACKVSVCHDLPCAERQTQFGAVCVCNSSYCDTVERPPPLSGGSYYHYTTSSDRPGFHRTTGYFQRALPFNLINDDIIFTVNPDIKHQEILGFGGTFTDAAGIVKNSLPSEAQKRFIESYFGSSGIEYSMSRVIMGMSDFSTRLYSYDEVENDEDLVHFNLTEEDYTYKIPFIREAMRASPHEFKLIGCPFTSPKWMKTSNTMQSGYIKQRYSHAWAKYYVKFLDSYANHSIPFWALTGGNEVVILLMFGYLLPAGLVAMPHDHMVWLRDHLAPQLAASNHSDVKFIIMDDMRPYANFWMSRFARDPVAFDLVDGVALHWYYDWISNASLTDDLHRKFPDKLILYTESSANQLLFGGEAVELGSWERAGLYAYDIIENLNHWSNGYLDWNFALNTDGGPFLLMALDAPIIVNTSNGEFYKNPMFYAMGHFSKFIPPGSTRVDVKSNQQKRPVVQHRNPHEEISAYRRWLEDFINKKTLYSTTTAPETTTPSPFFPVPFLVPKIVSCMATVNSDNSSSVIVFNGMDSDVNVTIKDPMTGYITATLTANSLNTFVYWP